MSVRKFTNEVMIITPYYEDYDELDNIDKMHALMCIERVCNHFVNHLQFHDFTVIGDDSLSIEVNALLNQNNVRPKVVNLFPALTHKFLVDNFVENGRDWLMKVGTYYNPSTLPNGLSLIEKMQSYLFKPLDLKEKEQRQKIEIIKRVKMHLAVGIPIEEDKLFKNDKFFSTYFAVTGLSEEELDKLISDDLDREWASACSTLENPLTDNGEEDTISGKIEEYYNLLKRGPNAPMTDSDENRKSVIVDMDPAILKSIRKTTVEGVNGSTVISEDEKVMDEIDLNTSLKGVKYDEYSNYSVLVKELTAFTNLIKEYSHESMNKLIKSHNLIIDFQISSSSDRSKIAPYEDTSKNVMILNVNLRSGIAEGFFKGGPFKISAFFNHNSNSRSNVAEW